MAFSMTVSDYARHRGCDEKAVRKAIAEAEMPEEVATQANKELKRLERMSDGSAESSMIRAYDGTMRNTIKVAGQIRDAKLSAEREALNDAATTSRDAAERLLLGHPPVLDHGAFGQTGRTGGVDHIGQPFARRACRGEQRQVG